MYNQRVQEWMQAWVGLIVAGVVIILLVISAGGEQDPNPTDQYCEMVQVHQETDGEYGWPDYDNLHKYCDR